MACISPVIASASVELRVGSEGEVWSNAINLSVIYAEATTTALSRTHGSWRGGTSVSFLLPSGIAPSTSPNCTFGSVESTQPARYDASTNMLTCVSPASVSVGTVLVYAYPTATVDPFLVKVGLFYYETPAVATLAVPDTIPLNEDADVVIHGSSFRDSSDLTCVINDWVSSKPARWLTESMVLCLIPAAITVQAAGSRVFVRVSNNNQDVVGIEDAVSIAVRRDNVVVSVGPLVGFEDGDTPITVVFLQPVSVADGSLWCEFVGVSTQFGSQRSAAFRVNSTAFLCSTPSAAPGNYSFQLSDAANKCPEAHSCMPRGHPSQANPRRLCLEAYRLPCFSLPLVSRSCRQPLAYFVRRPLGWLYQAASVSSSQAI